MKILIIGASGLVGSHCYSTFLNKGWQVLGTHVNFDTPNTFFVNPSVSLLQENEQIKSFRPDVIIHCGALTNVDYCEVNQVESYNSTVLSTKNIVEYCKETNTKLVYISTDYVFDGLIGPYRETEETNPINIYGKHKLQSENIVSQLDNYLITRITNVYGEETRAKNFTERLLIWLSENEEKNLQLPTDQFATPIYAGDIAKMLFMLIRDNKTGIYNLSSTDYFTRYQLAAKVISHFPSDISVKLLPVQTHILKQSARRPLFGGLLNIKFIEDYPDFIFTNIDNYILKYLNKTK